MTIRLWTDEELTTLRQYVALEFSSSNIGSIMGRTESAIRSKRRYVGLGDPTRKAVAAARKRGVQPRDNDDPKHLSLVLEASPHGFPFYRSAPAYRMRA